ncbi:MAG: DUF4826 family protein [Gammaproteobacteria bacterium]|nr:DUF4826 family protein [Gammaproteobacteria bacterium]
MTTENKSFQSDETTDKDMNFKKWQQEEYSKLLKYGNHNNLGFVTINQQESTILPPVVAVWNIESQETKTRYWLISGDLPTDHIPEDSAINAREAIRNFAMRWQLKAENILINIEASHDKTEERETKKNFAELLISKANGLYDICTKEELWKNYQS